MKFNTFIQRLAAAVVLTLVVPSIGLASEMKTQKKWEFAVDSAAEFEPMAAEIRQEMEAGKYSHLAERDRLAVDTDLNRVNRLLTKRDELSKLSQRDQVELVNAQERINAILIDNDAGRIICKLEAKVGTRMKTKQCLTVREWAMVDAAAERTKMDMHMGGGKLPQEGQ